MIYDRLENLNDYAALDPEAWKLVSDFIVSCGEKMPEKGKHVLDGDRVFVIVQQYNPHEIMEDKLEIHRNYTDIQLLLSGNETIYYCSIDGLDCTHEYDEQGDYALYRMENGTPLALEAGNFALFLPGEGHMPGVGDANSEVIKLVVKIRA